MSAPSSFLPEPSYSFQGLLEPIGTGFLATQIIMVPQAVVEDLGGKTVRRVVCRLNGFPTRLGLLPMKGGERYLMLRKELCKAAGIRLGDQVTVLLAADPEPDRLDLPEEFADGLAAWPEAEAAFEKMSGSNKRALAQHIADAKRVETRLQRTMNALQQLAVGGNPFKPVAETR